VLHFVIWLTVLVYPIFSVTFVAINCVYVKLVAKIQTVLSLCKLLASVLIISFGIYSFVQGKQN